MLLAELLGKIWTAMYKTPRILQGREIEHFSMYEQLYSKEKVI